jgi:hypothetical protein
VDRHTRDWTVSSHRHVTAFQKAFGDIELAEGKPRDGQMPHAGCESSGTKASAMAEF